MHNWSIEKKDRLQDMVTDLEKELANIRVQVKSQDTRMNEAHYLRNKLTEEKGALVKEIGRLESLNSELQRELDQIRLHLRERSDILQAKDKEIAALRKKELSLRSSLESIQVKFEGEATRGKDLEDQVKQLQRQLGLETQNALASKRDANEYQLRVARLQDEVNILQRDNDHLTAHNHNLQRTVGDEKILTDRLRIEIQELEERVKEIDRLKTLEDLIQTQRWEDISHMAQTMQSLSRTMARATSPTTTRKHNDLL